MSKRVEVVFCFLICVLLHVMVPVYGADQDCERDDCENAAPYVLRIINSGESKPRSSNETREGRQDNRRSDVTLTRKVPIPKAQQESASGIFGSGGTVWLSKDPTSLDRILQIKAPASVALAQNTVTAPIEFSVKTNYPHFIERLDILIWSAEATQATRPLKVLSLPKVVGEQQYYWNGQLASIALEPGVQLQYAIRATDEQGRIDQSERSMLRFIEEQLKQQAELAVAELSVVDEAASTDGEYVELYRQSIPIQGSKVRLLGQDLNSVERVTINGQSVVIAEDGRIGREYLLPAGEHKFEVVIENRDGEVLEKQLKIDLDTDYFFMVALADVTVGDNHVGGYLEPLAADKQHFGGDIFVDGRLAFYLKGKVRGKYLITAQMDTGTEDVDRLFSDFHRKDAQSIFRRLDPDQYYPVYGDDSTLIDDTDSQGKLYVRIDWDRSRILWGNYNTNFTGTEYAPFNRSLYGAQLLHRSTKDTSLGDAKHSLNVFASKAQSLFRHNEFLGTGGSLYYLRDTDIVIGSEKVWVEVRQTGTSRVLQKVALVRGRDYDIDDFQGRLILRRPLLGVAAQAGPSIIRDEPLAGNQTVLVVDYEYVPQNLDFNDSSVGVRAKKWIDDHVGIGATWALENRPENDYEIRGTDVTIKKSEQTYIKGEYAESESSQTSGSFISTDGGLSFTPFASNNTQTTGNAFGIEARASLQDYFPNTKPFEFGLWAKRQQAGFSTANTDVGVHTTDIGLEAVSRPSDSFALFARANRLERKGLTIESSIAGQVDYIYSDKITVSGELKGNRDENLVANAQGESLLIASRVSVDANSRLNVYGQQQATIMHSGTQSRNNATTLGATYSANDNIKINGEVSEGDRGSSALIGTEVGFTDTYSAYTNFTYSFDSDRVKKNSFVVGQRKKLSSQLKVYSEHQFSDEDSRAGYAHTVGLDQKFSKHTTGSLSAQKASIENDDGSTIDRNTVSVGLGFQKDYVRFNSKLEYRWDESAMVDSRQWVATNRFEYRKSPSLRWQGKFNASITDDKFDDDDARFVEAGIGFALRPVTNDRLNMLGRITYLNDLQPLSQSSQTDQRSLISSIEGLYDVTRLASARVRYRAKFGVDATAAYHWLHSRASQGNRQGALFTIGRRVGDNLTFSVGYNFTSFDDNLANDSYDVKGWFVNLIGTY